VASKVRVVKTDVEQSQLSAATGRRPFETPLFIVGARCVLRYIVLPFTLPLLGASTATLFTVATGAALAILVTLDLIAIAAIITTLRRLWRCQHPRRWPCLGLALLLIALVVLMLANDLG
jgi:hypothetical protein